MKIFVTMLACALLCSPAAAVSNSLNEATGGPAATGSAIAAERRKLEAEFLAEDAQCYKKFAVNSCLEKVGVLRRQAMADLRQQENLLNDAERKKRGEQQIRKTELKTSAEKLQQDLDQRNQAAENYQSRLGQENEKDQRRRAAAENETAAREALAEKRLAHQQKMQARAVKQAGAAEEARKFQERQEAALQRRAQHRADQDKRNKSPSNPLPLPE